MPWFLVDDDYPNHPGVLAISLAARGLWVTAGAWSSKRLTDVVPDHVVASLGGTPELAAELAAAKVWRRARGGYRFIQDGTCKIPSPEAVENSRKSKAERQARWREKRRRDDARVDAGVDAVDNSKLKPGERNRSSQGRSRQAVDASTAPSTWYPGPDPGVDPVVDVINRTNASSDARASPETIESIITEIRDTTGRIIDAAWAARIAADVLGDRPVASPAAYIRQAIRREPHRFLPTSQPPPVADVLAATVSPHGRHARKDPP